MKSKKEMFDDIRKENLKTDNDAWNLYFKTSGSYLKMLVFINIFTCIIGMIAFWYNKWIIGIICVVVIIILELTERMYPKDTDFDERCADIAEQKLKETLKKSQHKDLNAKAKLLYFIGIDSWNQSKKGKDGIMRFNPMVLGIFRFGKDKLVIDEVQLDAMNPNEYRAKSNEFAYKDIGEISIDKKTFSRRFVIKVCGQTEFDIEIAHNQQSNAEDVAREIRKVVRETAGASGESSVESNKDSK